MSIEEKLLFGTDPDFLMLDDIPEGTNIDLAIDHENVTEARRLSKVKLHTQSLYYCIYMFQNRI